jgi:hypothetical protein
MTDEEIRQLLLLPVAIDEVVGHREKRGGFIESEGSVGLWDVMSAGPRSRRETDELLEQVCRLGFRVCLCSGSSGRTYLWYPRGPWLPGVVCRSLESSL